MDFAFLNASILASYFPPEDPWLRGHDLPYYYFGYLMMGNLTELTFIPSRITYNLALALIPAMAGAAAFGLAYNLARSHGASASRGMGFPLIAPVLLLMVSNLLGALEFIRLRQWLPASFWEWLAVKGLGPLEAASWRPTEHLWWWRSTRVIDTLNEQGGSRDYTITEFPFFSFLLGDLHPHAMSIPFVLLFVAFGLGVFLSPARVSARWLIERPGVALAAGLLLGALAFINTWDVVTFGALWAALLALKAVRQEDGAWTTAFRHAWLPAAATLFLAIALYLPFYLSLDSQANGVLPVGEVGTRPAHFLIVWGLFLAMLLPFLLRQARPGAIGGRGRQRCAGPLPLKHRTSGALQGLLAPCDRRAGRGVRAALCVGHVATGVEHPDVVNGSHRSRRGAFPEHRAPGSAALRGPVQPHHVRRVRQVAGRGLRAVDGVAGPAVAAWPGVPAR